MQLYLALADLRENATRQSRIKCFTLDIVDKRRSKTWPATRVSQFRICFSMRKKRERESRNARRNRVRCNTVKSALDYMWKRLASLCLKRFLRSVSTRLCQVRTSMLDGCATSYITLRKREGYRCTLLILAE